MSVRTLTKKTSAKPNQGHHLRRGKDGWIRNLVSEIHFYNPFTKEEHLVTKFFSSEPDKDKIPERLELPQNVAQRTNFDPLENRIHYVFEKVSRNYWIETKVILYIPSNLVKIKKHKNRVVEERYETHNVETYKIWWRGLGSQELFFNITMGKTITPYNTRYILIREILLKELQNFARNNKEVREQIFEGNVEKFIKSFKEIQKIKNMTEDEVVEYNTIKKW